MTDCGNATLSLSNTKRRVHLRTASRNSIKRGESPSLCGQRFSKLKAVRSSSDTVSDLIDEYAACERPDYLVSSECPFDRS